MANKKAFDETFLNALVQIVSSIGLENLRTKQIAEMTGFSEATMFRLFPTKDDLLRESFLWVEQEFINKFEKLGKTKLSLQEHSEEVLQTFLNEWYVYLSSEHEKTVFWMRIRYSSLYTKALRDSLPKCPETIRGLFFGIFGEMTEQQAQAVYRNMIETTAFLVERSEKNQMLSEPMLKLLFELTIVFSEKVLREQNK